IVTPFDLCDVVNMEKRDDGQIFVKYTNGQKIINDTAFKTANLIMNKYKTSGVNIEIVKNIPFKAGLGGSSADAGAVAKGMQQLYSLDTIPTDLLLTVGSDVPYMYEGGDKRIQGVGEKVSSVKLPKLYKILLTDGIGVDTKKSYDNYDLFGGENQDIEQFLENVNKKNATFTNALQNASIRINKNIEEAISILKECDFRPCMTGSGSGVFAIEYDKALFESKLKKLIKKKHKFNFFIS
ncbi:MAG TPA: hypothetical protein VJ903_02580, partial [Clostridia bacterium]|nr:hypothetical protein [Clostridia bacterium]